METKGKRKRGERGKGRHMVPEAVMAVRASGRLKKGMLPAGDSRRQEVSKIEVEIGAPEEMLAALAKDAGVLEGGEARELVQLLDGMVARSGDNGATRHGRRVGRRCLDFLVDWACGMRWKDCLAKNEVSYMELNVFRAKDERFRKMYAMASDGRLAAALPDVLDSAIDLAVNGDEEPIVGRGGEVVAVKRRRDVRAMEMVLKAGDRRFAAGGAGQEGAGGGVTYNITMPTVVLPPPGQKRRGVEIEGEAEVVGDGLAGFPVAVAGKVAELPDID